MKKLGLILLVGFTAILAVPCCKKIAECFKERGKTKELNEKLEKLKKETEVERAERLKSVREFGDFINENSEKLINQINKMTNGKYKWMIKDIFSSEELKKCESYDEWDAKFQYNVAVLRGLLSMLELYESVKSPWNDIRPEMREFMTNRSYRFTLGL